MTRRPGTLNVFVGDGSAATAYDLGAVPPDPQSLDQVLDFLGAHPAAEQPEPALVPQGARRGRGGRAARRRFRRA